MSGRIMGELYGRDLTTTQLLVALAMADHADHNGEHVRPGIPLVAWKVAKSRRTVERTVAELRDLGILEVVRAGGGRGRVTEYRIRPDAVRLRRKPVDADGDTGEEKPRHPEQQTPTPTTETPTAVSLNPVTAMADQPSGTAREEPSEKPRSEQIGPDLLDGDSMAVASRDGESFEIVDVSGGRFCERYGCTYEEGHSGAHRDPWWDVLVDVFYEPDREEAGLFGAIAQRAREDGVDPEEIRTRAARLLAQWGPGKLTPASLKRHWRRFGSPIGALGDEEAGRMLEVLRRQERRRRILAAAEETAGELSAGS